MEVIEIYGVTGNRYRMLNSNNVKPSELFRRKLTVENVKRVGNVIEVSFSVIEKDRLIDFISRVNQAGNQGGDFMLHLIASDKWITSRIIDEDNLTVMFKVFEEDKMIIGNVLDI